MITKKIKKGAMVAAIGVASLLSVQSASAAWIDWTSTSVGTLDIGGTSVGVTLTGNAHSFEDGDDYYNNANTGGVSPIGTYAGLAPSDLIRVVNPSSFTLTFDQTVSNLNMALVSVGQGGVGVTYDFNDNFSVLSAGPNIWSWGYTGYTVSGDDFTGNEYNGILQFAGDFNSISFSTDLREDWHGFNFGSDSLASVSEPASLAIFALGIAGLAASRRRKI